MTKSKIGSFGRDKKKFREGVVYMYTNKINKKVYIGRTLTEKDRMRSHKNMAKNPLTYFDRAIKKYGWENFEYSVLFRTSSKNLNEVNFLIDEVEIYYIKKYNSTDRSKGYNVTNGGKTGSGVKFSKEVIDKLIDINATKVIQLSLSGDFIKEYRSISEALRENNFPKDSLYDRITLCKTKSPFNGKYNLRYKGFLWMDKESWLSGEDPFMKFSKEKFRETNSRLYSIVQLDLEGNFIRKFNSIVEAEEWLDNNLGIPDNYKDKRTYHRLSGTINKSNKQIGWGYRWMKESDYKNSGFVRIDNPHYRKIVRLDLSGKFIKSYNSIAEACRDLNLKKEFQSNIREVCRNNRKSACGFKWMWLEDYNKIKDINKNVK